MTVGDAPRHRGATSACISQPLCIDSRDHALRISFALLVPRSIPGFRLLFFGLNHTRDFNNIARMQNDIANDGNTLLNIQNTLIAMQTQLDGFERRLTITTNKVNITIAKVNRRSCIRSKLIHAM